jgi:hypothetical protein
VLVRASGVGSTGDGFVAAAKVGKGEMVAMSESLWWSWIVATKGNESDNAKLLKLLLSPAR